MIGRLNREPNPPPGEIPGYEPQHRASDGSYLTTGVDNPLPTAGYIQTDAGVWVPQKGTSDGSAKVQVSGSSLEVFGATVSQRPSASAVEVGTVYIAVNTQEAWQSNGSSWVEV